VSGEHIARRLQRLEWTSRFRPVHIQTVFLAAVAPQSDAEFLYAPDSQFAGEAGALLSSVQISAQGKSVEQVLNEFQKRGFLLIYAMECPLEANAKESFATLLGKRIPAVATRVRRSLKPKRVQIVSEEVRAAGEVLLTEAALGCAVSGRA